jgi:hypothetical protein
MARFDPDALHYWEAVRPRGEWPTVEVAPACTPRERRTVPAALVDAPEAPAAGGRVCAVCAEVAAVLA